MNSCRQYVWLAASCTLAWATAHAKEDPIIPATGEKIVVLPIEFAYYKYDNDFFELAAEKTSLARGNLARSMERALQRKSSLRFVALPELSAAEHAVVQEHTELLWLMATSATNSLKGKTVPWLDKRSWRIDYGIGDGLSFLAERTGAGKALFISGVRGEYAGGTPPTIGKEYPLGVSTVDRNIRNLNAMFVDLRTGDVLAVFSPPRGFNGEPFRQAGANTWMYAVFEDIPGRPLSKPPINQPAGRKYQPIRADEYAFMPPKGWRHTGFGKLCYRRHEATLEQICVDRVFFDKAVRSQGLSAESDPLQLGKVAMDLLKNEPELAQLEVASLTSASVSGRPGFRADLTSYRSIGAARFRIRHRVYGVASSSGAYLFHFDAPAIYYFEHHLPEFEAMVATFELL